MEIVAYPGSGYIMIETLHMDVDELVNLINNTIAPSPSFPNGDSKIRISDGKTNAGYDWSIYIPIEEVDGNPDFAKLIYALAQSEALLRGR